VSKLQVNAAPNGTDIVIGFVSSSPPKLSVLKGARQRIVIDFTDARFSPSVRASIIKASYFQGGGGVDKIRFAARGANGLRLVADLKASAAYVSHQSKDGVLNIYVKGGPVIAAGIPVPHLKAGIVYTNDEQDKNWVSDIPVPRLKKSAYAAPRSKPIIVIDPGHGGRDPGAIGKASVKEENITLAAALELRRQLLKTGKYIVVMTRNTDEYIEHNKRVRIARVANADLFISLHADSTSSSKVRGASVYTLANRAKKRSQTIINSQNWILDVDLAQQSAPVGDILVDLAQRKTSSKSAQFANILLPELKKRSRLVGNSHRKAGYYVLLAPDVPAVLLEMGFISNRQDEKLLNTKRHREKLMASVTQAINTYFLAQTQLQAAP
jgi:N-acetylmuramoyl-L-alanine amidase